MSIAFYTRQLACLMNLMKPAKNGNCVIRIRRFYRLFPSMVSKKRRNSLNDDNA